MRRAAVFFILFVTTSVVFADGMILPTDTMQDYLNVRYHHVDVVIDGMQATTHVEQEFYNPYPYAVRGQYLFPIPPDAVLADFEFTLDAVAQQTTRQDVAATNAMLYQMVADRRDPSLLQYVDWESLTLDIELASGSSRVMTIEYEQALAPENNGFHYRYILSTERYSAAALESASVNVRILTPGASSIYAPDYAVTTDYTTPGEVRVSWSAEQTYPTRDFDLYFTAAENGFGGSLMTSTQDGESHFMFVFAPEATQEQVNSLPKDIVFVIDRSGSMNGEKMVQARDALTQILGRLNVADRFSVVGFDDLLDVYSQSLRPVDRDSIEQAYRFVDSLTARGGTDIAGGLQQALAVMQASERRADAAQMIVFLTDGLATAGITVDDDIRRLITDRNHDRTVRIHAFGVGYDVNTHLLDGLAADNGGTVTYVQPGENIETVLTGFYSRIANPILTDVQIEFEGIEATDLYPQALPDLFEGSSVILTGRYTAASESVIVRVTGSAGGEAREYLYEFDLAETGEHGFVSRLWATRRIGHLLDIVRVEGESEALRAEIRAIGLAYGIVTPYTTFVIVPQTEGAASASNMELYSDLDSLNQSSGSTTVQARVQNQMYQDSSNVAWAQGANIVSAGRNNLMQVGSQYVDLSLVAQQPGLDEGITPAWIAANIDVDIRLTFGSPEYFALASDPSARPLLQNGTDIIFPYNGQTYWVQDGASGRE
jgi:Ca-activated chloride channel family protein